MALIDKWYQNECDSIFLTVESLPDVLSASRNHAYIIPDGSVWVLNRERSGYTRLTDGGSAVIAQLIKIFGTDDIEVTSDLEKAEYTISLNREGIMADVEAKIAELKEKEKQDDLNANITYSKILKQDLLDGGSEVAGLISPYDYNQATLTLIDKTKEELLLSIEALSDAIKDLNGQSDPLNPKNDPNIPDYSLSGIQQQVETLRVQVESLLSKDNNNSVNTFREELDALKKQIQSTGLYTAGPGINISDTLQISSETAILEKGVLNIGSDANEKDYIVKFKYAYQNKPIVQLNIVDDNKQIYLTQLTNELFGFKTSFATSNAIVTYIVINNDETTPELKAAADNVVVPDATGNADGDNADGDSDS